VTWTNTGSVQHTVTDDPSKAVNAADAAPPSGAPAWDSGPVNGDQTFSHTFTTPGTYKYFCIPHESGETGHASSLFSTNRQVAASLGVAVLTMVLTQATAIYAGSGLGTATPTA
jgi:hypothetical protein